MNNLTAIGRIGRDAVTRHTQAGKAVTGWSLAVDAGFGDKKVTTWLDCTLWGDRGVSLAEHIKKGDRLGVSGEIATREHEGKTYITLNVREVTLLGDKKADTGNGGRSRPAPQSGGDDFGGDEIPFITNQGRW